MIDSLSISPNSFELKYEDGTLVPENLYSIEYSSAKLFCNSELEGLAMRVKYRVFPISFTTPYSHKSINSFYTNTNELSDNTMIYSYNQNDYNSMFGDAILDRRGSISRGISVGNNQDVVMNSHLNLQLSGKLSDDIDILAAISDNNIPIQPDGTSQQLQEFDKVFIKIFNSRFSLTVGDFEISNKEGYFMKYYKKVQGANFTFNSNIGKNKDYNISNSFSGAVSKGKYSRQQIQGQEGVQGPYKLIGANNETYIIVLGGTEKVYIDGKLMLRGLENDYVIDYNTAEIVFTPNQPINKDKRITIEFEYSERSYARFSVTSNNIIEHNGNKFWLNIYSEQDNKNQAFDQDIGIEDRHFLSQVGDNLNNALIPNVDSVGYNSDEVLYALADTLVGSVIYDSIYVYSTQPDKALYRLGFAYVGQRKGNYVKSLSAVNGKVYKWVAPEMGKPQGDYEPVVLLVTPKKKQLITLGGDTRLWKGGNMRFELGLSQNDINTFSKLDAGNNTGTALRCDFKQSAFENKKTSLTGKFGYQLINHNFEGVEHYRNVEFVRNWNLDDLFTNNDEHMVSAGINYSLKNHINLNYESNYLMRNREYKGTNNQFSGKLMLRDWKLDMNASLLNSSNSLHNTRFIRHRAVISKEINGIVAGVSEQQEHNLWQFAESDSLAINSFAFTEYQAYINTADSMKNGFNIAYKYRNDYLPQNNKLLHATTSQDFDFGLKLLKNPRNTLKITGTYRLLEVNDTSVVSRLPEDNLTGRIEYSFKLLKGVISSSSFYEIGAGLERRTEFSYMEVASGQGVYQWTDYNENGIKELDEFELAYYQDQANYIRVFTPTNEYIKTYTNQFNQMLNINPQRVWRNKTGMLGVLSRFSNQLAYRVSSKNTSSDFAGYANPFAGNISDTSLVNMNAGIRNAFSFNKGNPVFGLDYIYQNNRNKTLLVNGFDSRYLNQHGALLRWNITRTLMWRNTFEMGQKEYSSEFFAIRNYDVRFMKNKIECSFQPNMQHRISVQYQWKNKFNTLGNELLTGQDIGIEYRMSSVEKGVLTAKLNYVYLAYQGGAQGPVGYEMLEGLLPGNNFTWQINFQRQLANGLMINVDYSGRSSEDSKLIHTGSVQLRAFF